MTKTKLRICYAMKANLDFVFKIIDVGGGGRGGSLAGAFCCKEEFCSGEFVLILHPQKIYHDFRVVQGVSSGPNDDHFWNCFSNYFHLSFRPNNCCQQILKCFDEPILSSLGLFS